MARTARFLWAEEGTLREEGRLLPSRTLRDAWEWTFLTWVRTALQLLS